MRMPEPIKTYPKSKNGPAISVYSAEQMKQFGRDVLEAAAVEAEDSDIVDGKGYYMQGGDAVATQRNIAAAIRKLKETL